MLNNLNNTDYEYIDKYGIFNGFIDKIYAKDISYRLYDNKEYVSFSNLYLQNVTDEEIKKTLTDDKKRFESTLNYIVPLIKEGKLKVRIIKFIKTTETHFDFGGDSFYDKNNVDDFIKDLKEKYFSIDNRRDLDFFKEFCVQFTLPENEWLDWKYV